MNAFSLAVSDVLAPADAKNNHAHKHKPECGSLQTAFF